MMDTGELAAGPPFSSESRHCEEAKPTKQSMPPLLLPWIAGRSIECRLGYSIVRRFAEELWLMEDRKSARSVIQDAIAAQDWTQWLRPPSSPEWRIPAELKNILDVHDEPSSWQSVMNTEYAFGNSESGTYYPAVVPAIPILALIVQHGEEWPRWTAIEILHDWLFSFYPEQKQGWVIDTNLPAVDLQRLVQAEILNLQSIFEEIGKRDDLSKGQRSYIDDFLTGLDDDR